MRSARISLYEAGLTLGKDLEPGSSRTFAVLTPEPFHTFDTTAGTISFAAGSMVRMLETRTLEQILPPYILTNEPPETFTIPAPSKLPFRIKPGSAIGYVSASRPDPGADIALSVGCLEPKTRTNHFLAASTLLRASFGIRKR